mmetsp:Transcript_679/g.1321  ORF Transcript_679/g.1321 Transcript_679/m.1321 type:complete len:339 (+) Transcript_679:2-1018(+)
MEPQLEARTRRMFSKRALCIAILLIIPVATSLIVSTITYSKPTRAHALGSCPEQLVHLVYALTSLTAFLTVLLCIAALVPGDVPSHFRPIFPLLFTFVACIATFRTYVKWTQTRDAPMDESIVRNVIHTAHAVAHIWVAICLWCSKGVWRTLRATGIAWFSFRLVATVVLRISTPASYCFPPGHVSFTSAILITAFQLSVLAVATPKRRHAFSSKTGAATVAHSLAELSSQEAAAALDKLLPHKVLHSAATNPCCVTEEGCRTVSFPSGSTCSTGTCPELFNLLPEKEIVFVLEENLRLHGTPRCKSPMPRLVRRHRQHVLPGLLRRHRQHVSPGLVR